MAEAPMQKCCKNKLDLIFKEVFSIPPKSQTFELCLKASKYNHKTQRSTGFLRSPIHSVPCHEKESEESKLPALFHVCERRALLLTDLGLLPLKTVRKHLELSRSICRRAQGQRGKSKAGYSK